MVTHELLWDVCKRLPSDYEPYGDADRDVAAEADLGDCSSGCIWFAELKGVVGLDFGICANTASPRAGLLTFEHQGCPKFERRGRQK